MRPPFCPACLEPAPADTLYHPACLQDLFRCDQLPLISLTRADIPERAVEAAGKLSISGAQPKITLSLSPEGPSLSPQEAGGHFILKPQVDRYQHMVENEHATMHLARRCGIDVPPFTLVTLQDHSLAYLVRRFDRPWPPGPDLYRAEDFCALSGLPSSRKYEGTVEGCVQIIRRFSDAAPGDLRQLFLRTAFCYLTANGDMHLKNFMLLKPKQSLRRLSPAYDLLCTFFYVFDRHFPDDTMALSMRSGTTGEPKSKDLTGKDFLALAAESGIAKGEAQRILQQLMQTLDGARELLARSALPTSMQERYAKTIRKRSRALMQGL